MIKQLSMSELIRKATLLAKKEDFESAYDLLVQADLRGDSTASYALGTWHLFGRHVKKDPKKAVSYFLKASRRGSVDALFNLAICYEKGKGIDKNLNKAFRYYYKAFNLGDKEAAYEIGRMLYYGIGVEKNRDLAEHFIGLSETKKSLRQSNNKSIQKPARETRQLLSALIS